MVRFDPSGTFSREPRIDLGLAAGGTPGWRRVLGGDGCLRYLSLWDPVVPSQKAIGNYLCRRREGPVVPPEKKGNVDP